MMTYQLLLVAALFSTVPNALPLQTGLHETKRIDSSVPQGDVSNLSIHSLHARLGAGNRSNVSLFRKKEP